MRTRKTKGVTRQQKVKDVCILLEQNKLSTRKIAERVGVDLETVYRIWKGDLYPNISSKYNIDKYEPKSKDYDSISYDAVKVHKACELMEENFLSYNEVSDKTGIPIEVLHAIANHQAYVEIGRYYSLDHFLHRYERDRRKDPSYIRTRHIIDDDTVHKICQMLEEGTHSISEIARRNGVVYSVVYNIKNYGTHREISKLYKIENHPSVKGFRRIIIDRRLCDTEVHAVCALLEKGQSVLQVHANTRIAKNIIEDIFKRRSYTTISSNYNF